MSEDYRKMAIWIAIAGCDRSTYWDAIMDEDGTDWTTLNPIGLRVERDDVFVNKLRANKELLLTTLAATRALFAELKGSWQGPDCPTSAQIESVVQLSDGL